MKKNIKEDAENNNKTISFVLSQKLIDALNAYSRREERSVSWVIRKALENYLKLK